VNLTTSACCRYCGAAISPNEQRLGAVCRDWRCRRTQLNDDLRRFRDEQAAGEGRDDPVRFEPIVIPYSPRALTPLPSERRAQFLEHLDALLAGEDPELPDSVRTVIAAAARTAANLAAAVEEEPGGDSDGESDKEAKDDTAIATEAADVSSLPPDGESLSPASTDSTPAGLSVCAACRGVCCHDGDTHAFLDVARIGQILQETGWTGEELRERFVSYFPNVSTENACIFQAEEGCRVPRETRSHLCNSYACSGLRRAEELIEGGATGLFAAARSDNRIRSGVFLVSGEEI